MATHDSKFSETGFPSLQWEDDDLPTRPIPMHELPLQTQIDAQMRVISQYHPHIAEGIVKFWGHRDCVNYLQTLMVQGYDSAQRTRMGFKTEVSSALLRLADLHRQQFPHL